MSTKYQSGDTIISKHGLNLRVQSSTRVSFGKQGRKETRYQVACERCGHLLQPTKAGSLENRKKCPGCEGKPAALKTDDSGNCLTICRMGQVEFIHKLITNEGMSQREAAQTFIEAMKAHTADGDPLTSDLTVEQIRAQFRRETGKLKDKRKETKKTWVAPTQKTAMPLPTDSPDNSKAKEETKYRCLPTIVGVQIFLDEYLPGHKIVSNETLEELYA